MSGEAAVLTRIRAEQADSTPALPHTLTRSGIARLALIGDFKTAEPHWRRLEQTATLTAYQRFDWMAAWQRHVGTAEGVTPLLLTGFDAAGDPLFLLPLGYAAARRFKIVRFLGGKHANYNFGPWRRGFSCGADALHAIIGWLAEAHPGLDGIELLNQPESWDGVANPFLQLPHQQSPSPGFRTSLRGDPKEVLARLFTSSRRKRLRYRERKLESFAGYRYVRASTAAEVDHFLPAFFAQKADRLAHQGIGNVFAAPGVEAFVRELCLHGIKAGKPVLELHALDTDAEVIATFACVNDGERFSSMFNSYATGEVARYSPGIVLLSHMLRHCVERGLKAFDLGVGEAAYKTYFCDELDLLFDTFHGLSPHGRVLARAMATKAALKRRIKHSPALLKFALALRRLRSGKPSGGETA